MAVHYNISTWNSSTSMEAREFRKVRKLDAAQSELWRQIYAMCAADGALDTERAHRLLREFNAFVASPHPLPQHNSYFSRDFVLRTDGAGNLDHVRFVAVREG